MKCFSHLRKQSAADLYGSTGSRTQLYFPAHSRGTQPLHTAPAAVVGLL